ncbi:hypothetical protein [Roseomonas sp. AR75]|uniref:hypothetical protein n=1 Tax=Roseomonas sp. AR75 TaxID=2562311 RepID=UPI0010C0C014|nr:hypothetical protein [Roseomonas sp. AR75]
MAPERSSALPFRGLELHGQGIWRRDRVTRALDFMQAHGLNALVLHESDLVHHVVYPRRYFDPHALWRDVPSRRGENAIFNNRAYLHSLLAMAGAAGVETWVNVKEIGFSDEVLALWPELFKGGAICPSEPFWSDYIAAKTDELLGDFPALAGIIVSFGSQESRASRVQHRCRCDLCAAQTLEDWYGGIIAAMHGPVARRGKRLAVRDFAYKPEDHAPLIAAMRKAPGDVVFSIKAMPHDFYITFPDNPALGALREREQWVEYDCLGQFFGWGIMPCLVLDDLAARLPRWRAKGAGGAILRIEWERINDLDALDNLAALNLMAGAALIGGDASLEAEELCRRWLRAEGHVESGAAWLADVLRATLPVVRGTVYTDGFVTADNSMLPRSVARAWWGAEVRDSLACWVPERVEDLRLDRSRLAELLAEKDRALAATRLLAARVEEGAPGLDVRLHAAIRAAFRYFEPWVEGHCLAARVCLLARFVAQQGEAAGAEGRAELRQAVHALEACAARLAPLSDDPTVPHQVVMLLDHRRARDTAAEGAVLAGVASGG